MGERVFVQIHFLLIHIAGQVLELEGACILLQGLEMQKEEPQYLGDVGVIGTLHSVGESSDPSSSPHPDKEFDHRCSQGVALEVALTHGRLDPTHFLLYLILSDGQHLIAAAGVLLTGLGKRYIVLLEKLVQ